ncbi:MAG: DUF2806 domain-containing protein [Gammaproteobacteria bacterium]|nr:MAG: DUF2806 domain-containing protein [Gammaproteobacteria bacterium]
MRMGNLLTALVQFFTSGTNHSRKSAADHDALDQFALRPEDRLIFEALCQFVWIQGDPLPLIFDLEDEIYTKQGINQSTLKHLEEAGLIAFDANGFIKKGYGKHTRLFYSGKPTKIGFQTDSNNYLDLGHVLLTERGKKLALVSEAPGNQQFYEYVIERWYRQGLLLSSIQVDRNHNTDKVNRACSIKE